jgi:hypothetical protein
MTTFAAFNSTTGNITKIIVDNSDEAAATVAVNVGAGEESISVTDETTPANWYITNPGTTKDLTARPLLSTVATWSATSVTANNVATITFGSSLPNPTAIEIIGPAGTTPLSGNVTDGTLTLSVGLVGEYIVKVTVFPYVTQSYTITGT